MITVVSANFHTQQFVEPFERSILKTTKRLKHILIATPINQPLQTQRAEIIFSTAKPGRGSMNHGTALNQIIPLVKTEYLLLMDIDCFLFHQDWDDLLIPLLDEYALIGARSFRTDTVTKTKMLHANFIFGKTKDFQNNIDYRPNEARKIDTAGNLTISLKDKKIYHVDYNRPTKAFIDIPRCAEYRINDQPIWYHFGRGAVRARDTYATKWIRYAKEILKY